MAISINEGLMNVAKEYDEAGDNMVLSVGEMDESIGMITRGEVVYGEEAPQDVASMWEEGGVREAMESYGKKLKDVAVLLEYVYNTVVKVDASSTISSEVTVENAQ